MAEPARNYTVFAKVASLFMAREVTYSVELSENISRKSGSCNGQNTTRKMIVSANHNEMHTLK